MFTLVGVDIRHNARKYLPADFAETILLPAIAELRSLESIDSDVLHGAQGAKNEITDAGLEHLKGMTNLRELSIRGANVKVTETGAMKLATALPQCLIQWGNSKTIQPKIAPERKSTDKE